MKKSRYTEEQISYVLRQAEAGSPVSDVCRGMGISEATFYTWKKKYGELGASEVRRLRQLDSRRHLLTDGTKYLAEGAECFWMMDVIASHLSEIGTEDWFVQVRMTVKGNRATMIYEDGCGKSMLVRRSHTQTFLCMRFRCLPAGTVSIG